MINRQLTGACRRARRGYTLVELLVVVGMIGILAALALVGYRKYMNAAHTGEPKAMIQSIRAAQEIYKAEMLTYMNASPTNLWYPTSDGTNGQGNVRWNWLNPAHGDYNNWKQLSIVADAPVRFAYQTVANAGSAAMTTPTFSGTMANPPSWPPASATAPGWYIVVAQADRDSNNTWCMMVGSSYSGQELYTENEGE